MLPYGGSDHGGLQVQKASLGLPAMMLLAAIWAGGCSALPSPHINLGDFGLEKAAPATRPPEAEKFPAEVSLATKATPSPELHVAAARLSEQSGKVAEAERHYQRALKLDARHAGALVGYARLRDRQGRLEEATELYQRAAKAHPNNDAVLNDLGLCLARRRLFKESVSAFERAVLLQPKKWLYRNNVAMVLVEMGDVDAAVSHLRAVQGEAVAQYNVGYILQKKGDSQAAAAHFARALKENPSLAEARAWLEKLESEPASLARSSPRVTPSSQPDPRRATMPAHPAPPGAEATSHPVPTPEVALPVPGNEGARGRMPAVRQLPPVANHLPKTAPPLAKRPVRPVYSEPAPLPPPSSIGQPGAGEGSQDKALPVVHPLPPVEEGLVPLRGPS